MREHMPLLIPQLLHPFPEKGDRERGERGGGPFALGFEEEGEGVCAGRVDWVLRTSWGEGSGFEAEERVSERQGG